MKLPDKRPLTYLITPGRATDANLESSSLEIIGAVKAAVDLGVSLVQIREKKLSAKYLIELAANVMSIVQGTETRLMINDRVDVALALGVDGVHLTTRSLPVERVRRTMGNDLLIGVSTHSPSDVSKSIAGGADFAVFGPIFASPGKDVLQGLDGLREVCREFASFPIFGLGGIDETNFRSVLESGAAGVAAIRALNILEDESSVQQILSAVDVTRN